MLTKTASLIFVSNSEMNLSQMYWKHSLFLERTCRHSLDLQSFSLRHYLFYFPNQALYSRPQTINANQDYMGFRKEALRERKKPMASFIG